MRPHLLVLVPAALSALACAGGDPGSAAPAAPSQDVRGVYAVTWSDALTIRLDIGGAVQEHTAGVDEIVTFNAPDGTPLELDLAAYCADPAVTCPSEAWPATVAIDQDDVAVEQDLHTLRAWDAAAPGAVVNGLVDHTTDQLLFGLDGASDSGESCAALALSLAGGTFAYAEADSGDTAAEAGPVGIVDGGVAVGWAGVCAWSGLAVAATLSVETTYEAERTGPLE